MWIARGAVILGNLNADILNLFLQHFSRRPNRLPNLDSLFSYTLYYLRLAAVPPTSGRLFRFSERDKLHPAPFPLGTFQHWQTPAVSGVYSVCVPASMYSIFQLEALATSAGGL